MAKPISFSALLLRFAVGVVLGVALWEGPRAWLVWRAHARREAALLDPHPGAGIERVSAGLTDATRLLAGFSLAMMVVSAVPLGLLVAAILTSDDARRDRYARWAALTLGVLLGGMAALYLRVLV